MNASRTPPPLTAAIREIAEANAELHIATPIMPLDCITYASSTDVIAAFWSYQRATGDDCEHMNRILSDLHPAERAMLHSYIAADHSIDVTALRRCTITHIAHWLADEATQYQDSHGDAEPEYIHTPTDADRRALAAYVNARLHTVVL
jgi:hypothetical protein